MPYSSTAELPAHVRKLPAAKQRQWMHVFNSALQSGDSEATAFKKANGAVRASEPLEFMAQGQPRDRIGRWTKGGGVSRGDDSTWESSLSGGHKLTAEESANHQSFLSQTEDTDIAEVDWQAIDRYRYGAHEFTNEALRGKREMTADSSEIVRGIDSAMDDAPGLAKASVAYRGVYSESALSEGTVFTDKGFISTSSIKSVSREFAHGEPGDNYPGHLFAIQLMPGQKGLYLPTLDPRSGASQGEFILPRGTTFKVGKKEGGITHLTVVPS